MLMRDQLIKIIMVFLLCCQVSYAESNQHQTKKMKKIARDIHQKANAYNPPANPAVNSDAYVWVTATGIVFADGAAVGNPIQPLE